ncbi:hypothetical protein JOF41_004182 [Saccharothrix coeruleofusca]|uniref:hypothetical protein n=1 Tax=Saccharothrix coeruleofusca TaxID=33919 RepID=UPI001AEBA525|nr:hypothetical protein [Saccharothrix coeruleofusca]MBP2338004.1 hypothetical protein [Saccharothrix coeruleofusca]
MLTKNLKFLSGVVIMTLIVLNALTATSVVRHRGSGWQVLALLLVLLAAAVVLHTRHFHRRPFLAKPKNPFKFHQVPVDRAASLQREAKKNSGELQLHEARVFAGAVVKPEQFRRRVVEEYTPSRRTLQKLATVDLDIPKRLLEAATPQHVYLPVVINQKGDLLDDFHIYEANSDETQWLSYRQYLGLAAEVLHILLLTAYRLPLGSDLPPEAEQAELLALQGIVQRRDTRAHSVVDFSGAEAVEQLQVASTSARKLAGLFVRQLTENYPIVASVHGPVGRRHRFKYQLTLMPEVKFGRSAARRWAGFFRLVFGTRPVDLNLDISNAPTCESFHLHVHAPDDLFLTRQEATGFDEALKRRAEGAPTLPHCRFRRRLGQPHAHFYCRYMPAFTESERPAIRLSFFEVPPGSVLRAAITAAAALAILWLIGFVNSRFPDPGTDAPAFLLAFPAVAAAWLGFDAPSRKLLEGTLSARLCLVVTAMLSLTGCGLFMLHKSFGQGRSWPQVPDGNSLLGITDLGWAITVALALLNAARIGYQCLVRTWQYSHLLAKEVH